MFGIDAVAASAPGAIGLVKESAVGSWLLFTPTLWHAYFEVPDRPRCWRQEVGFGSNREAHLAAGKRSLWSGVSRLLRGLSGNAPTGAATASSQATMSASLGRQASGRSCLRAGQYPMESRSEEKGP